MKKILVLLFILPILSFGQNNKIGIYYQSGDSLVKINPIKTSGHKTNTLGAALTMGLASSNMIVKFRGSKSVNQVDNAEFVFFFQQPININLITDYYGFTGSNNPNNFILVKLKKTRSGRELNWGKYGTYSGLDVGVPDENVIPFKSEMIDENTYRITPVDELKEGEYAFIFDGANGSGAFMPVFDFGVK